MRNTPPNPACPTRLLPAMWPAILLILLGCSEPPPQPMTKDLSTPDEDLDLRKPPSTDMAMARCELPFDFRAIDRVSAGAVMVTQMGAIYTASVDATAGGINQAQREPYVYLDLIKGAKVMITDVQARDSKDWDIGLKRYIIKINSGDSGPGGVTVATVENRALEDVTQAPDRGYQEDRYFDENCMVFKDAIGGLATAMSDWYSYNTDTMVLTPLKNTFVLKRRDGRGHIKMQIMRYYDAMGRNGGTYTIRWSFLP